MIISKGENSRVKKKIYTESRCEQMTKRAVFLVLRTFILGVWAKDKIYYPFTENKIVYVTKKSLAIYKYAFFCFLYGKAHKKG